MRTQSVNSRNFCHSSLPGHEAPSSASNGGIISEIVYAPDQPVLEHLLIPLLRQLGMQSRWLLWLSPQKKISRHWLQQAGLPLNKTIQLHHLSPVNTVDAMEKALLTGNYSAVLCWLSEELSNEEKIRLQRAAQSGNTYGFIMRPENKTIDRLFSTLKIHSRLYH
ncbi:cell division inhibitor SulA [Prodigiosinella confusarubida]|uniref:Cell division inhibitor SulA n=1 Tax=Serratia sp. (strain ATCC 39006) TaxID=104623 RepID=A0A2I5T641_SERS3|nr:SOS-induced cell division inhibitor SulA [Serratia sp. ATCC 39006]AUH00014.1 cell division inhibitor SulA [Serratia sp. ATCC 39006]AUH04333.1 cell division inhibitor SulA [Serratia sp. ATCC 39006]